MSVEHRGVRPLHLATSRGSLGRALLVAAPLLAGLLLAALPLVPSAAASEPPRVGEPPEVDGLYGDYHWALEVDGVPVAWFKQVDGLHLRVAISEVDGQQEARLVPVDGADPLFGRLQPSAGVTSPDVAAWLSAGLTPGRRPLRLVPWLHDATPTLAKGAQCTVDLGRGAISEVRLEAEWKGRHRLAVTLAGGGGPIEDDCDRLRAEPSKRSAAASQPKPQGEPEPEQQGGAQP